MCIYMHVCIIYIYTCKAYCAPVVAVVVAATLLFQHPMALLRRASLKGMHLMAPMRAWYAHPKKLPERIG